MSQPLPPSPNDDPRGFLPALFHAAVASALSAHSLARFLPPPPRGRTLVLCRISGCGSALLSLGAMCARRE